jgi:hypothetical protein
MGIEKKSDGAGKGPKPVVLEFSAKQGAFTIYNGRDVEPDVIKAVSGEIVDMMIWDPLKPFAGEPKPNADAIPIKLVVELKDGEDRYRVTFPMNTHKDKSLTFTGMKAIGALYGTLMHHFVEKEAGRPHAVRLAAGLTDNDKPWFHTYGQDADGKFPKELRIAAAWGVKADGTLDHGVQKEVNGVMVSDAPTDFTGTIQNGPQKGTQYIETDKVLDLVTQMVSPFDEARAERNAKYNAQHDKAAGEAGIDPDSVDEAHQALRQRG